MRAIRPTGGFRIAPPSKECFGVPVSSWPAIPNGRCMSAAAAGGGTAWTRRRKPEERLADLRGGQPVWARRSGIGETERLPAAAYRPEVSAKLYAAPHDKAGRRARAGYSVTVPAEFAKPAEPAAMQGHEGRRVGNERVRR